MKRLAMVVALTLVAVSCQDIPGPRLTIEGPHLAVSDGGHGGNPHFFFLPPMVPQSSYGGTFDGSFDPVVEICFGHGPECNTTAVTYTMETGPGSETVRVVEEEQHYIVNWQTDLVEQGHYQIRVLVGTAQLGYADVSLGSNHTLKNVDTDKFVPLKDGRTLPIKFRIEEGAVGADFVVNTAAAADDGTCDPIHCSLREALNASNASMGLETIGFHIPGPGPHSIQPLSALPAITDPVILDGYSQPGASSNTNGPDQGSNAVLMVELDGSAAEGDAVGGLEILAGNSTVRGLAINHFRYGIGLLLNGGNTIEGNFIGTDVTGLLALGNGPEAGVAIIGTSDNVIGGVTPGARNVISGNAGSGIFLGAGAANNVVQGNLIGTDITGAQALGNAQEGVNIDFAPDNIIGGTSSAARNVISGNGPMFGIGVAIFGGAARGNQVMGNFIGTDVSGTRPLGNTIAIHIGNDASDNTIGGGAGNVIAYNGLPPRTDLSGVLIESGSGNAVLSNSIFDNLGLGIDLFPSGGVTPNDEGDTDTGANGLQNFPVVTSATSNGSAVNIAGELHSSSGADFRLEFFASGSCDPTVHGEGEMLLGWAVVTTDGAGNADFVVTFSAPVPVGQVITATATDPNNSTSEFSECAQVAESPLLRLEIQPASALLVGTGSTVELSAILVDVYGNEYPADDATWTALAPAVANIDPLTRLATAMGFGQAIVRAEHVGAEAYALLTVGGHSVPPVSTWTTMFSGTSLELNGVWGTSSSNVFAVGGEGTILHFDGTDWSAMVSNTARTLNAVWGTSASDVFAVGNMGTIVHFDGSVWLPMDNPAMMGITGVWGASPRDVLGIGPLGTAFHYDGEDWIELTGTIGSSETLYGIAGWSAKDVMVTGNEGVTLHFDGADWTQLASAPGPLMGIWGFEGSRVFGCDNSGNNYFYNGVLWQQLPGVGSGHRAITGTSDSDVYTVGALGFIGRYDGTEFRAMDSRTSKGLHSIWTAPNGDVFAVGELGTVLHGTR